MNHEAITKAMTICFLSAAHRTASNMAGFKSAVNSKIDDYIDEHGLSIMNYNRNNHFFQPNYHDHIIRNDVEYRNISNYIKNNPANWQKDKFQNNNG